MYLRDEHHDRETVECLRPLVACISPWKPDFNQRPASVSRVLKKTGMERIKSDNFRFDLSVSFHHRSILILFFILLLPEGQVGEDLEVSNREILFQTSGNN
jgi:hypothetical protein